MKLTIDETIFNRCMNNLSQVAETSEQVSRLQGAPEKIKDEIDTVKKAIAERQKQIKHAPSDLAKQLLNGTANLNDLDMLITNHGSNGSVFSQLEKQNIQDSERLDMLERLFTDLREQLADATGKRRTLQGLVQEDLKKLEADAAAEYLRQVKVDGEMANVLWAISRTIKHDLLNRLTEYDVNTAEINGTAIRTAAGLDALSHAPA